MGKNGSLLGYYVLFSKIGGPGVVYSIKFNNDTVLYHTVTDLKPFGITTATKFPVRVTVSSRPDGTSSGWINITALEIAE